MSSVGWLSLFVGNTNHAMKINCTYDIKPHQLGFLLIPAFASFVCMAACDNLVYWSG